jgi:hypothetical protein
MLLAMQKEYLIELGDAVIAVREASGRIKLNQLFQPVAHRGFRGAVGFSDRLAVHDAAGGCTGDNRGSRS